MLEWGSEREREAEDIKAGGSGDAAVAALRQLRSQTRVLSSPQHSATWCLFAIYWTGGERFQVQGINSVSISLNDHRQTMQVYSAGGSRKEYILRCNEQD